MPDPKAPETTTDLLRLIEQSGIFSPAQQAEATRLASTTRNAKQLARRLIAKGLLTRWQASQLLAGWHKLLLGKYRLCELIDRSESGRIFRAEHVQLDRPVAIKTLSRRFTSDPEVTRLFLEEASQASQLDHHNVQHTYDVDKEDDRYYLVMEYIDGDDLNQLVSEHGPLSSDIVLEIAKQAAAGLAYLHGLGMLHQNLRPKNLMVDAAGHVKIVGLGMGPLASQRRSDDLPENSTAISTTDDPYLAPEQLHGNGPIDHRADLFSLGRIMQWLLTGQPPVPLSSSTTDASTPAPSDQPTPTLDVPSELAAIIDKLTAAAPADRYQSADDLLTALDALIAQDQDNSPSKPAVDNSEVPGVPIGEAARSNAANFDEESPEVFPAASNDHSAEKKLEEVVHPQTGTTDSAPEDRDDTATDSARKPSLVVVIAITALLGAGAFIGWWINYSRQPANEPHQEVEKPPIAQSSLESSVPERGTDPTPQKPPTVGTQLPEAGEFQRNSKTKSPPPKKNPGRPLGTSNSTSSSTPAKKTAGDKKQEKKNSSSPSITKKKKTAPSPVRRTDPFKSLPNTVDIGFPDRGGTNQTLGNIALQPSDPCELALVAATPSLPETARFRATKASSSKPHVWNIQLQPASSEPPRAVTIARFEIVNQQLTFHWTPASQEHPEAAQLVNHLLHLRSRAFQHDLGLRKPIYIRPLLVNLKRLTTDTRARIHVPPPAEAIRFQILTVEEPLPKDFALQPDEPVAVPRKPTTSVWIAFTDESAAALRLEVKPSLRQTSGGNGDFRLLCTACFQLIAKVPPQPMSPKNLAAAQQTVTAAQLLRNAAAQKIRQEVARLRPRDPRRKAKMAALNRAEKALARAAEITNKFEALQALRTTIAKGAAINFRVFFVVGEHEIDLLRTDVDPDTATIAQPPGRNQPFGD